MILARTRSRLRPAATVAGTASDPARLVAAAVALVTGAVLLLEWVRRTAQYVDSMEANKTSWHIRPLDDFVGAVGLGLLAWSTAMFVLAAVRARRRRRSPPGNPEATATPQSRPEAPETR